MTVGNDSQTYGTPADLTADLPATVDTGVNGENLAIGYSSDGDTATAMPAATPSTARFPTARAWPATTP